VGLTYKLSDIGCFLEIKFYFFSPCLLIREERVILVAETAGKTACYWCIISPGVIITMPILTAFTEAAMHEAKYKILEDGTFYGEIQSCPGVWANKETLESCREVLREVE
jgi:hypothetical protein